MNIFVVKQVFLDFKNTIIYMKISLFQLLLKIGMYNYVIRKIYTTFFINS